MYVNKEKYEKITPKQRTRRMAFDANCFISVWKQVTKTLIILSIIAHEKEEVYYLSSLLEKVLGAA